MPYESEIHERVWALFEAYRAPEAVMWHIPNGEKRGPRAAAKLKRMGVVPGVPDFCCMARGRVTFLELKRAKGRVSDDQSDFIGKAYRQGVTTFVAHSVEVAVDYLQDIGVLRADINFTACDQDSRGAQDGSGAKASDPSIKFTKEAVTAD